MGNEMCCGAADDYSSGPMDQNLAIEKRAKN